MKFLIGFDCSSPDQIGFLMYPKETRSLGMTLSKELHNHITCQVTGHWIRQCLWFFCASYFKEYVKFFSRKTCGNILLLLAPLGFLFQRPNPGHHYTQACISVQISCGFGFSIHALGEETLFCFKQTMDYPLPVRQLASICQRLPHDRS